MNNDKAGGPAFPEPGLSGLPNGEFIHGMPGMTLRDYFAGQSITSTLFGAAFNDHERLERAKLAYKMADAMLEARK